MTEEIVKYMCKDKSAEEIASTYSKKQLTQMYACLFTMTPQGQKSTLDLAYSIRNFISDSERTADLCKLLR